MKKFIQENKLVSSIISFFFILFTSAITYNILWGTWVTNQIFAQDKAIASYIVGQKEGEKSVKESVKTIKENVKGLKEDLKKLDEKVTENNEKILKLLIEIKKK